MNETEVKNELIEFDDQDFAGRIQSKNQMWHTLVIKTNEDSEKLYNAINVPDERLKDMINKKINIVNVIVQTIQCVNDRTGETHSAPRFIIIDDKGKSYVAVSVGIFTALNTLFQIYGNPPYATPITVEVKQISKGTDKSILTLSVGTK